MSGRVLTAENSKFQFFTQPTVQAAADGQKTRKFSGTAYSGKPIPKHYYWGQVIFDLDTMSVPNKLPALLDHDRSKRAGFVNTFTKDHASGLVVEGQLLSNEHAKAFAEDSDAGFPWQMSVHIEPGSIEEVDRGHSVTVNGQQIDGPATVFRNSTIVEASFTATGHDSNTTALAMSRGGNSQPTGDSQVTEAEAQALKAENERMKAEAAANAVALKTATDTLAQFSADARTAAIKQLFTDTGREFKADAPEVLAFSKMDGNTFELTAGMLRAAKPAAQAQPQLPNALFSHQADTGTPAPTTGAPAVNPLMADAEKRAKQFSDNQANQFRFGR